LAFTFASSSGIGPTLKPAAFAVTVSISEAADAAVAFVYCEGAVAVGVDAAGVYAAGVDAAAGAGLSPHTASRVSTRAATVVRDVDKGPGCMGFLW